MQSEIVIGNVNLLPSYGQQHLCGSASSPGEWRSQGAGRRRRVGGLSFADGREWDCRSTLEHSSTLRLSSWSRLQKDIGQSVQNGLLVEIEHLSRLPLKRMEHQMEIGRSRLELVLETARFLIGHGSQLCLRREWNFSSQSSWQRVNMKVMKDGSIFVGYFQTLFSF